MIGKPNIILFNQIRHYHIQIVSKVHVLVVTNKRNQNILVKYKIEIQSDVISFFWSPVSDGMPILGLYDVNIYVDSKYIFSVTKQCEECSTKKKGARNITFVFQPDF